MMPPATSMKSFLDNLSTRRAGRDPPPLPISIQTRELSTSGPSQPPVPENKMTTQHHGGLGILDGKDWDDVKHLDWDDQTSRKSTGFLDLNLASPIMLPARKASWVFRRLRSVVWPKAKPSAPEQPLRKTAYLDGLRGFAAFLVYWQHHQLWAHEPQDGEVIENAFGFQGNYHFATFLGTRLLFNGGHFAVATFFVMSGYVLSTKPLSLIQAGEQTKLADNLASQLFRRWLRLYIPLIVTTFLYMLTWHAFGGLWIQSATKQSNIRDEMWWWYAELKNFSFIFNGGGDPWFSYNVHLWSIPVEMKGSVLVYMALMALSRATTRARLWCEAGLMFYFLYIADGWYCCFFMAGMFLADLDLLAEKKQLPGFFTMLAPYKKFIYYHFFAIAIYLGGVPSQNSDITLLRSNRGWYYLSFLKPQAVFDYKWFYLFFAATFLVSATPRIRWLKAFFETRFCQYLGRVSFALYLVHGPVLWTLGDRLYTAVGWAGGGNGNAAIDGLPWWVDRFPLPKTGPLGLEVAFLVPHIVLLPVTFWAAEMVTRYVDEPAVRFAQWCYRGTLPGPAGVAAVPSPASPAAASGMGAGAAPVDGREKKLDA